MPNNNKSLLSKIFLSLIVLPLTATYQLSFLAQPDPFLQVAVFSLSIFIFCLSWYKWTLALYVFIFCIPMFNTINSIFVIPWPGININAAIIGAILTAWVYHYIWNKPISDKEPSVYLRSTPLDGVLIFIAVILVLLLPVGWVRFNNVLCPGFYDSAARQLMNIPFFSMLDNYLCFTRFWQFAQVGIAFYLVCSSIRHRDQLRNVLWLIVISGAIVGSYGIFQYYAGFRWVGINWFFMRVNATLNGPHAAGIYFATLMVLCVALFFATQSYWRKVMMFAAACATGGGLWFSGTRTAAFALVIVLAVLALAFLVIAMIKNAHVRKVFFVVVAVLLFLGPGYSLIMPTQGPFSAITKSRQFQRFTEGFNRLASDKSSSTLNEWLAYRFYHWTSAANVIKQFPTTGSGIGTFDKLYRRVKLKDDTYKTAFAHAFYLDVLVEQGAAALIGIIFLYCIAIVLSWKLYRAREVSWRWKLMGMAMLVSLYVTFVSNFFTSDFYYVLEIQLWFAILLALVVCNYQLNFDPVPHSFSKRLKNTTTNIFNFIKQSKTRIIISSVVFMLILSVWLFDLGSSIRYGYDFFKSAKQYTLIDRILEYGIFYYEKDAHKNKFARTAESVYKPIKVKDKNLRLFLRADHPDAKEKPVKATVKIDDVIVGDIILSNREWKLCRFDLGEWIVDHDVDQLDEGIPAVLNFESSRTWNPYKLKKGKANHDYGVDLGAIEWGYY